MKVQFLTLLLSLTVGLSGQSVVDRHGQLSVEGTQIVDACGRPTQLKGMSFFWSQFQGSEYWTEDVVGWLAEDWRVELLRAPVGVGYGEDYRTDTAATLQQLRHVLDGAIEHGVYVIVDWHAHDNFLPEAREFFRKISAEYGDHPNIIYELWNEPVGEQDQPEVKWREIKSYAEDLIAVIRENDPDNLIVVGTPFWSQRVDVAAADPITRDSLGQSVTNIAYTLHFYAGAHKQALRDYATTAYDRGLPIFVTESGRVGTNYGPDNELDAEEWATWEAWMEERQLSYTKWSLSTKMEKSSSLLETASTEGGWREEALTEEGKWNREHFRTVNAERAAPCEKE